MTRPDVLFCRWSDAVDPSSRCFGQDESMAAVSFRDVAVPDGGQPCCPQPMQVSGGVGVVPEHVGTEVWRGAGPPGGSDDGQEIAARPKPVADTREQCLLVRERNMDQGVEGRHG